MTSRDVADGIGHREDSQAEGKRNAQQTDSHIGKCCREYGTAATAMNQPKCSKKLRAVLPHVVLHILSLPLFRQ